MIESTLAPYNVPKVWQLPLTLPVARMRISDFTETILRFVPGFSGAPFAVAGFLPLVRTVLLLRGRSIAHLRSVDFFWGRTMAGTDDFRNVCLRVAELSG